MQPVPTDFEGLRAAIISRGSAMPKRLEQVAAYALENPDEIAFGTAASIAKAANVQPSTLVRLAHFLGFEGFSHFQSLFKEHIRFRTPSYEERLVALEKDGAINADSQLLRGFFAAARASLDKIEHSISESDFARAVEILGKADTIYLIAKRRSFPLTAHMSYAFSKLGIRHHMVCSPNGVDEEIVQMARQGDAGIAISFSPYAADSVGHARLLNSANIPLVAITDSVFSPLASLASVWLEVAEADFAGFRSLSASLVLAMSLPVAIAEFRRQVENVK